MVSVALATAAAGIIVGVVAMGLGQLITAIIDTLSMGMTDDYRAAIFEGATIVRIGTAIFGPRA